MSYIRMNPWDRYALIGKTGSGKTALGMVMGSTMAMALPSPWEVWWIDTKNDPDDLRALRKWGFRNAASEDDRSSTGGIHNALYWRITSRDAEGNRLNVTDQVQMVLQQAYERQHVVVVIDEYVQAVYSSRSAGEALLDVFQRGRGRKVGLIGMTQEPVFIPRQLISQATHLIILSVTHQHDIDYIRKLFPDYVPPILMGNPHGFYWKWVDGTGEWEYFAHQQEWYRQMKVLQPKSDTMHLVETIPEK